MQIISWNVFTADNPVPVVKFFSDACSEEQVLKSLKNTKEFRGREIRIERRNANPAPQPVVVVDEHPEPEVNPEFYEPEPEPAPTPEPKPEDVVVPITKPRKGGTRNKMHPGSK